MSMLAYPAGIEVNFIQALHIHPYFVRCFVSSFADTRKRELAGCFSLVILLFLYECVSLCSVVPSSLYHWLVC